MIVFKAHVLDWLARTAASAIGDVMAGAVAMLSDRVNASGSAVHFFHPVDKSRFPILVLRLVIPRCVFLVDSIDEGIIGVLVEI